MVKQKLIAILFFLALFLYFDQSQIYANTRMEDSSVIIRTYGPTTIGYGSGTIIKIDHSFVQIVTAKHVATSNPYLSVSMNGDVYPAKIVALSSSKDLAIIEIDVPGFVANELHSANLENPKENEPIHIWGSGHDGQNYKIGKVDHISGDMPDYKPSNGRYLIDCEFCHEGDSGGGIFNNQGHLIGIYIGYFTLKNNDRLSVAERIFDAVLLSR